MLATTGGPFISGSTHTLLRLGQRPDTQVEAHVGGARQDNGGAASKGRKSQLGKKGRGSTTLQDLVKSAIITPGKGKITVVYKGITYTASLQKDGLIAYQGQTFSSATAFSIHCKRLQTPNKQGDDGWKSVLYEGTPLEHFRAKFQAENAQAEIKATPTERWPSVEGDDRDDWLCDYADWDVGKYAPFSPACAI